MRGGEGVPSILLTTVEWEMGFCVTLLQQIAAWSWLTEDSHCFFLTRRGFQRLVWDQRCPAAKLEWLLNHSG